MSGLRVTMMRMKKQQPDNRSKGERGSVIIMATIFMVLIFLMIGMVLDLSRIYMIRAEVQNAADAAALTAARELNAGTTGIDDGIAKAQQIVNTQGFGKRTVVISNISYAVDLDGTYIPAYDVNDPSVNANAAKAQAANIRFVKVTTQPVTLSMLFAVGALGASRSESRDAVAGLSVELDGVCDFFPMAVSLTNPTPTIGTVFTLTFTKGTGAKCPPTVGGSDAKLCDQEYIVLEVPQINGNGCPETAKLAAGLPNFCKKLGDTINMTPSSNVNNGPRCAGDGVNTRMNGNDGDGVYPTGYGQPALSAANFPPDANIRTNITYQQYKDGTAVTTPNPNGPGSPDRRLLVSPILTPGVYPNYTTNINHWGVFFIKNRANVPQGNCDEAAGCGALEVEYIGKTNVAASGSPSCGSELTTVVLYK
jgi:Flp pilus assembly protein TadG